MSPAEQKELKEHSMMLGQICGVVEDYCFTESMTTLDAVKLAVADARMYRGRAERLQIEMDNMEG